MDKPGRSNHQPQNVDSFRMSFEGEAKAQFMSQQSHNSSYSVVQSLVMIMKNYEFDLFEIHYYLYFKVMTISNFM